MTRPARMGIHVTRDEDGRPVVHHLEGPSLPITEDVELARQNMLATAALHDGMVAGMEERGRDWGAGYVQGIAEGARRAAFEVVAYALGWSQNDH